MRSLGQCYMLLGVARDATLSEVEDAYERQLEKYDADVYADDPSYRRRKKKELNDAYAAIRVFMEKGYDLTDEGKANASKVEEPAVEVKADAEAEVPVEVEAAVETEPSVEEEMTAGMEVSEVSESDDALAEPEKTEKPLTIETPNADAWLEKKEKREKRNVLILAALLVILAMLGGNYEEPVYVSINDYANVAESDLYVAEVVAAANAYLLDYEVEHPRRDVNVNHSEEDSGPDFGLGKLSRTQMKFFRAYWNKELYERITDYLEMTYEGYTDYGFNVVDNSVYAFYGFMTRDEILGYINPFTGRVIDSGLDLMDYYIRFYEAYSAGEIS